MKEVFTKDSKKNTCSMRLTDVSLTLSVPDHRFMWMDDNKMTEDMLRRTHGTTDIVHTGSCASALYNLKFPPKQ